MFLFIFPIGRGGVVQDPNWKIPIRILKLASGGGWVGGNENNANSAQLKLELGLSLAKMP